jgi:tRNA threonylcarbamoyladenosine biosynthesis protein TsaB
MITLAIDTSDARGSVSLLRDGAAVSGKPHDDGSDYSGWLLPAVNEVLAAAGVKMEQVDLLAVSTGPGSFTGLRVGLTTVKAWAEVYGKPIVGASRLEAIAHSREANSTFITTSYDAQRGQLFAAVYRRSATGIERAGHERVISPEDFARQVDEEARDAAVSWISLDPQLLQSLEIVQRRAKSGDEVLRAASALSSIIGKLAERRAATGQFSDPMSLDANYVRRSDAEIFWKGPPADVR